MDWKEYFKYDENSPSCLIRLNLYHKNRKTAVAGYKNKRGYWRVCLGKEVFAAHRIIFEMFNPNIDITELIVDHIDGDLSNNRIINLRATTQEINSRNSAKVRTKKHGEKTGVTFYQAKPHYTSYWVAYVMIDGKLKHKYVSINKHGNEEAYTLACEWRDNKIAILNENGAQYSERHGL